MRCADLRKTRAGRWHLEVDELIVAFCAAQVGLNCALQRVQVVEHAWGRQPARAHALRRRCVLECEREPPKLVAIPPLSKVVAAAPQLCSRRKVELLNPRVCEPRVRKHPPSPLDERVPLGARDRKARDSRVLEYIAHSLVPYTLLRLCEHQLALGVQARRQVLVRRARELRSTLDEAKYARSMLKMRDCTSRALALSARLRDCQRT